MRWVREPGLTEIEDSRYEQNQSVIRRIVFNMRIDRDTSYAREKADIAFDERRPLRELKNAATYRMCDDEFDYCWIPDHFRSDLEYPYKFALNQLGNKVLWLPNEITRREAMRLHVAFNGIKTHVGSRYIIVNGRPRRGSNKWDWPTATEHHIPIEELNIIE